MSSDAPRTPDREPTFIDHLIRWIGSETSLVCHTIFFVVAFALPLLGIVSWSLMLLIVTTIVSLEAIYLAIFIQMTVNRHSESLKEVEQDLEEIEEDLDELQEDVEEMSEEEDRDAAALESITTDVHKILTDLEELKKDK